MIKKIQLILISICAFLCLTAFTVPNHSGNGIYDELSIVSQNVRTQIEQFNRQMTHTDKKPQIAIAVLKTLNGDTIENAALHIARQWQIGYNDTNNGALIVIAMNERKMRIETSDVMATYLPDYKTKQLLDAAKDDFRVQRYTTGIERIVAALMREIMTKMDITIPTELQNQLTKHSYYKRSNNENVFEIIGVLITMFIAVFAILPFIFKKNRRRRHYEESNDLTVPLLLNALLSARKSTIFDDDDDDFWHGGSSGSSNSWGGGGFSGGGSSSSW